MSVDIGKLVVMLGMVAGGLVLLAQGHTSEGVGLLTFASGYTAGNGMLARRNGQPAPMITRRHHEDPSDE